jgi:RNA polymerase sigma-70 factor, ECF subfamily
MLLLIMSQPDSGTFHGWLIEWRNGSQEAADRLFATTYQELRRLAAWEFQRERPGHTMQPTALVNELYIKLFAGTRVNWQNRAHFFAVAAQQMRRILIDHARARLAEKRGGAAGRVPLADVDRVVAPNEKELIDLDQALSRLEQLDQRLARVVELRFFGGLTQKESAEVLGTSVATLKRDWEFARAWLGDQLGSIKTPPKSSNPGKSNSEA